ncbi:hypothetical protein Holit_03305 [Hollandina sp. SP2]
MKIDNVKLEELKAARPGGLLEGAISFNDEENRFHEAEFIFRKPTTADMESYTKSCQRNPLTANLNLVQSLIVYPEAGSVIEQIRDYPSAVGRFVDEAVSPFFGANAVVRSRKL